MNKKISTKYMATVAMLCAVSFVAVLLSKVIPNVAGFLSYEPKDVVIVIAGFIYGPLTSLIISVIVSFVEMISISTTGIYGMLMNIVSTAAFTIPAACVYKKAHSRRGALNGLIIGVIAMTACMVAWNYVITPFYMGVTREKVAGMLLPVFLPFNFVKSGINAALAMLLYKPVVGALRRAKLVPPSQQREKNGFDLGFNLVIGFALLTLLVLFLVLAGIL